MGLFQHKKSQAMSLEDKEIQEIDHFFDDELRDDLRERGKSYFDRAINENVALFKQDLDAIVSHINTELRQHATRQLDEQMADISKVNEELRQTVSRRLDEKFAEYGETIQNAQDETLKTIERNRQEIDQHYQSLSGTMQKSITDQEDNMRRNISHQAATFDQAAKDSAEQISTMKAAHAATLQSLTDSARALENQNHQLSVVLKDSLAHQEAMLMSAFEGNMAQVVEHYLLEALGDQFDVRAQLPGIVKQLEANKQSMVDDIAL